MKVKLRDVSNVIMGQSPDSSTYNTKKIGLPFFQGNADFGELNPIAKTWCSAPIKIAYKNYILISVRAPIGALNIAAEKCCIGRGLAALDVNNKMCTQKYLWYLLKAKKNELLSKGTGSTFKAISKNILSEMEFNIPPVREQELCTKALDVVFYLIRLKKEQLDKLDLLVKSRFIEMFGTFPDNPKGWECCTIRDIVKEVRYGSSRPAVEGGQYPYLRMNNITYEGTLDLSEIKYIDVPEKELEKCTVRKGDVLFNRTNSKELVGKTCLYDRDESMVLAGFIIRVRVNDKVVPEFLVAFLNMDFSKKMLFNKCKAAIGQANINAQELQNIEIYLPPLALQKEFVSLKYQVDKSKLAIQQSLDELETLKKSLMQQYFG